MTEPKKIRFTQDGFFGIKAGDEVEVHNSEYGEYIRTLNLHGDCVVYLHDLKGFYEVMRWKPKVGIGYNYVTDHGVPAYVVWKDTLDDNARWKAGNCEQDNIGGRERSKAKADKILAIFKEGV